MSSHHILQIDPPVEELVHLHVEVVKRGTDLVSIVRLRKEPRGTQHYAGQLAIAAEELAEILSRHLGHPVDVPWHGHDFFVDPDCASPRDRGKSAAECARRAGEDERADSGVGSRLEHVESSRNVGVHELGEIVAAYVRLVEGCRVDHGVDTIEAAPYKGRVENAPYGVGLR